VFKIFGLRIVTEVESRAVIDNTFRTAARLAQPQTDFSKPLSDYERGRRDACSDILLMVQPSGSTSWKP
jgi:hypothetical protein